MVIRTLIKNLSIFSNWQTMLVTFLLEPAFTVLFYILLTGQHISGQALWPYLSLMMGIQLIVILAQLLVKVRDNGLLSVMFANARCLIIYLGSIALIAFTLSVLQGCLLYITFALFSGKVTLTLHVVMWLFISECFTLLFGLLVTLPFLQKENPYFGSNLLVAALPILSATLVPITSYPEWLGSISRILPFWLMQSALRRESIGAQWLWVYGLLAVLLLFHFLRKRLKSE